MNLLGCKGKKPQVKVKLSNLGIYESLNFSWPLPRSLPLFDTGSHLNKDSFPSFGVEVEIQPTLDLEAVQVTVGTACGVVPSVVLVYINIHQGFGFLGYGPLTLGIPNPPLPLSPLWLEWGILLFAACLDMWSKPIQSEHRLLLATMIGSGVGMWPKLGQLGP